MGAQIVRWENLLEPKLEDKRAMVSYQDLEEESRKFTAVVQNFIEKELFVTAVDARKASDAFWESNLSAREKGGPDDQGRFGTRIRIINKSLLAEWYVNRFFNSGLEQKKKRVLSTHIAKGRGFRYPKRAFVKATDWEKEIIESVEDRYELLRRRSNILSKLRRALGEYERLLDKCYKQERE